MNDIAIKKLRRKLQQLKVSALLVSKESNIAYLSEFQGQAEFLITPTKKYLITDQRFIEQAKGLGSWQIFPRKGFSSLGQTLGELTGKLRLKRLAFESTGLSFDSYQGLRRSLKTVRLIPTTNLIEGLREIKQAKEIKILRKAARVAVESARYAKKIIRPGKKESEIARKLQYYMRGLGAEDSSFSIIVAAGKRSSLPHALISERVIKDNQGVLVDLGCRVLGYNSDLTRMVFLGKIGSKLRRIYRAVLEAQKQAIRIVRAGVMASEVDLAARNYLKRNGLGPFFLHALGHGIGRQVHEAPTLSPKNNTILKAGMVVTIEPGVYFPGWGGVRIEDMVLVKENGCEILTQAQA